MSNFNYNNVDLAGRLVSDPILRTTPTGIPVCNFSLAVNKRNPDGSQGTDFFNLIAWRNVANFIAQYFKKGSAIFIRGSIHNKTWKDQNQVEHYSVEITVDQGYFIDSKQSDEQDPAPPDVQN